MRCSEVALAVLLRHAVPWQHQVSAVATAWQASPASPGAAATRCYHVMCRNMLGSAEHAIRSYLKGKLLCIGGNAGNHFCTVCGTWK